VKPRLLVVLAAFTLAGLAATSCSTVDPPAATVNGVDIDRDEFQDEVERLAENLRESQPDQDPLGEGAGTLQADFVRGELRDRILDVIISEELDRRGRVTTDSDLAFAQASTATDEFTGVDQDIVDRKLAQRARLVALAAALIDLAGWDDASLQALYDADPTTYEQTCVSHILVATEAEALAAKERLDEGEGFGALAQELSTDTGSAAQAGALGCLGADVNLVPEFAEAMVAAEVGVVTEPVETQFGFHLILVTDRSVPDFATVRTTIQQRLVQEAGPALQDFLGTAVLSADVTVDSRYGAWDPTTGFIVELGPEAPATTVPDQGGGGASTTLAQP